MLDLRPNRLQTVVLEPDDNRLTLIFHAELPCDKAPLEVQMAEVEVAALNFTAGWSRA